MINLDLCKKILNKGKNKYTNEQIKMIRENLYKLADIELQIREKNLLCYGK